MIVLDASALLAMLNREPGRERVLTALREDSVIGVVNLAEVVTRLTDRGWAETRIREVVGASMVAPRGFDAEAAYDAGLLRRQTRHLGLSLGDRACLSLARQLGAPVLTADRAWLDLDIGVEIEVIR